MKYIFKRLLSFILIIALLLVGFTSSVNAKTDYNKYSNDKKAWYISRKSDHKPSGGAMSAKELKKYNAYYIDTKNKEKVMYLAFDCGYENGYTNKILDTLKKHKAKAIFFVTKDFIESNPKICKRMKKEGHLVGNHTMTHPSLPDKSLSQIKNEVKGVEKYFKKRTGYELDKFIRPPMGNYSNRVLKLLDDMGYKTIFWSIAYYDYDAKKQPGKQYVINHFKQYHHKGAITLMHTVSSSNAAALDEVLTYLEKKGYEFRTMDLLEKAKVKGVVKNARKKLKRKNSR